MSAPVVEDHQRVVVISGAASGMGAAAVRLAAADYAVVVALDLDDRALADLATDDAAQAILEPATCDITSADQVQAIATHVLSKYGRVDTLLNFAGVSDFAAFEATTPAIWHRQVGVNLGGTYHACQAFGKAMCRQGRGAIVNVASTAGTFGVPGMAAYTAAKHGVVGLTRALAVEWARSGVRVNCICPGATMTSMLRSATPEFRADRLRRIPLGRFAEPEDQARVALFLASDEAAYVTGAVVPVDGGIAAMAPGTSEAAIAG